VTVDVLTAIADPRREASVVAALARGTTGVRVARRCVDLADLLAAAAAGLGNVAVVSADLRRLDREALTRLAASAVAVVAVVPDGDDAADRRIRQLGVRHVLADRCTADEVAEAVGSAVADPATPPAFAFAGSPAPAPRAADAAPDPDAGPPVDLGTVVAVWGPTGAPGRSTVAVNLAAELAALGTSTVLVDADVYGGSVAQLLGMLDESPGLAAACRLANNGTLDLLALAELALEVRPGLRVVSGISRADRWPELRSSALEVVLDLCRRLATVTVVDCGFCLERDEELSFDGVAPRRNGATLTALAAADSVVAVATADPVGLQRFVRGLGELVDVLPDSTVRTVVNRTRDSAVGGGSAVREITAALDRFAGVASPYFLPQDGAACDAAVAAGRTLGEVASGSRLRLAIRELAMTLAGLPGGARANGRRRRGTPVKVR
jgi:MinD-like ATPase involved in chromosome partitioning or flagellar assembly